MNRALLILLALTATALAQTQFPSQSLSLFPQKTDEGVLFQCRASGARVVYLAGDFNGWAKNVDGRITDSAFAMTGPDTNGVWQKTVKLEPGVHHFKFNLNGAADGWFAPDSVDERDSDKNAVIHIDTAGAVMPPKAINPKWRPQFGFHSVIFQCYAPKAHVVYLAGDFNDWGGNHEGLVFDPRYILDGPDAEGVWRGRVELKGGRHLYQFVIDGDQWMSDPNGYATDNENHSVVELK